MGRYWIRIFFPNPTERIALWSLIENRYASFYLNHTESKNRVFTDKYFEIWKNNETRPCTMLYRSCIQNFIQFGSIERPQSVTNWLQVSKFCTSSAELKTEFFTKNISNFGKIVKQVYAQCCIEAAYKTSLNSDR